MAADQASTDPNLDLVSPQALVIGFDDLSDDLKYLSGTGVPHHILLTLQKLKATTFEQIMLLKWKDFNYNKDIIELQESVSSLINIKIKPSLLFEHETQKIKYFSTYCPHLDALINPKQSGLASKSITSFLGVSSSGKTLLLMQCMANCVLQKGSAIFIDCHNQFDVHRYFDVLKGIGHRMFPGLKSDNALFEQAMERSHVYSVCSFQELQELLNHKEFIKQLKTQNVDMLCIDNVGLLVYAQELNSTFRAHGEINKLGRQLKYLCVEMNLCVVTSSLALSSRFENEYWIQSLPQTALSKNWDYFIDTEIHLLLTTKFGAIRPILSKSQLNISFERQSDILLSIGQYITEVNKHTIRN